MAKIATWNVNSVRARLPRVLEWLAEFSPDVALLQEIKVVDEALNEWLALDDRVVHLVELAQELVLNVTERVELANRSRQLLCKPCVHMSHVRM